MPVHDWSRMPSGIFHDFHQAWTITIRAALNNGILPKGYAALAEQHAGGLIPDVLTLQSHSRADDNDEGGVVARTEPQTRFVRQTGAQTDAQNGNRIVIRHALGRVVAMIVVVSPGNKESRSALYSFVQKTVEFLQKGVHVLIVDLFPPARRDPNGIHKVIWDEFLEEEFELPEDERVTLVSYRSGIEKTAFIEPIAIGDILPDMPIYLDRSRYVMVPLEATYQAAWLTCPEVLRVAVETGELPTDRND